jgi:hypothetical protein
MMISAINWEPFVIAVELFFLFVGICFLAAVSDLWAKSSRKSCRAKEPVAWLKGERVFLN